MTNHTDAEFEQLQQRVRELETLDQGKTVLVNRSEFEQIKAALAETRKLCLLANENALSHENMKRAVEGKRQEACADLASARAVIAAKDRELENLRAQMVEVPMPRLDLVNDFSKGSMLIGGPCIHGVSNNGFDCPKCHPPIDLKSVIKDGENELKAVIAALTPASGDNAARSEKGRTL